MIKTKFGWAALAFAPALLLAAPAWAVTSTEIVIKGDQASVARASVQLFNADTGAEVKEQEDDDRRAALFLLDGGRYRVVVDGRTVREITVSGTGAQRFEVNLGGGMAAGPPSHDWPGHDHDGPGLYGTIGYSHLSSDIIDEDVQLGAATARLGVRFGPYFGIEGEGALGAVDDTIEDSSFDIEVKLNHDLAVYAVVFLPVADRVDLFARAGWGSTEVEARFGSITESESGGGFRYGVGGQIWFDPSNAARVEFTHVDTDGDNLEFEADVFTISYVRRFR